MDRDSLDVDPERDLGGEASINRWLPALENHHLVGEVVGLVLQSFYKILFRCELKLEQTISQICSDGSGGELPVVSQERNKRPDFLL